MLCSKRLKRYLFRGTGIGSSVAISHFRSSSRRDSLIFAYFRMPYRFRISEGSFSRSEHVIDELIVAHPDHRDSAALT